MAPFDKSRLGTAPPLRLLAGDVLDLLVVDDSPSHLARVLQHVERRSMPFRITPATSLSRARRHLASKSFDLVVSDFRLVDGSGVELIADAGAIPVVIVSDSEDGADATAVIEAGAKDHLLKDGELSYLEALRKCVGGVVVQPTGRRTTNESLEQFQQIAQSIDEVLWTRSADGRELQYVGPALHRIWMRPPQEFLDHPDRWFESILPDSREEITEHYRHLDGVPFELIYRILRADGAIRWVKDAGYPVRDARGHLLRYAGVVEDITELVRRQHELHEVARDMDDLASHDPLTGLANRRGLERILVLETARARRAGTRVIAILVDCDDFKRVNDAFGHAVGDCALREIADRLSRTVRPQDCVARVGGDEFLVLLSDTRIAEAYRVAERLRVSVGDIDVDIELRRLAVTISLGLAEVPQDMSPTTEHLLSTLHSALKRSKGAGKNRVAGVDRVLGSDGSRTEELADDLCRGRGFSVHSQSIRSLVDETVVGLELLTRGPAGPLREPTELFRVAKDCDLLESVDMLCLRRCLDAVRETSDDVDLEFHVNVFPSTLMNMEIDQLHTMFGEPAQRGSICVELSEQHVVGDPSRLRRQVNKLRDLGVRISLDHVGFGRSSLEALIVLEPDQIKIDGVFVHGCGQDPAKRSSLTRLTKIAAALSAELVAEGIETTAELRVLGEAGVAFGQGFLWDRPQPCVAAN